MNALSTIQKNLADALSSLGVDPAAYLAMVKPVQDPKFGDYQANCAMPLAKALQRQPRDVAQEIVNRLDLGDLLEAPEVAGPGFINLRLKNDWIARQVQAVARAERLGVEKAQQPRTIVIDFSSPNVAKPLHVGHLRSTIIGDSLSRLLGFLGHNVITDNHLGDWGTQFGILLYGYKHFRDEAALRADPVREMTRIYVHVRKMMAESDDEAEKADNPIAEAARQETARLQAGDAENVRLWKEFMPVCLEEIEQIYRKLDVHFDHTHGESFYNPMLAAVVEDFQAKGLAEVGCQGAIIVNMGEGKPPALIRKKDGAFNYTTSDLATIRYRMETWKPDAILYVVGAPQALHFQNLFEAARRWGYDRVELLHIAFGSVLGADRKILRTRDGGVVELGQLLNEAIEQGERAYARSLADRTARGEPVPELTPGEKQAIAEVVGIGAVKYADLAQNRLSDYVFGWEKMLATEGNTATYMQYAYARNRNIFRKGGEEVDRYRQSPPLPALAEPEERALALKILQLEEALEVAAKEYQPHAITGYLWDLAKTFSGFYQSCHVLNAETTALRQSRLLLCDLTARVIQQGLALLGIKTVERM
jgi:arginyl-tRNA synthetase